MSELPDPNTPTPPDGETNFPEETLAERHRRLRAEQQPLSSIAEEPVDDEADTQPMRVSASATPPETPSLPTEEDQDLIQTMGIPAERGDVPVVFNSTEPDFVQTIPMPVGEQDFDFSLPAFPDAPDEAAAETQSSVVVPDPDSPTMPVPDWSDQPTILPPPDFKPGDLPQRVDEQDQNATRVTPAAYTYNYPGRPSSSRPAPASTIASKETSSGNRGRTEPTCRAVPATDQPTRPSRPLPPENNKSASSQPPLKGQMKKHRMGCFWRGTIILLFVGIILFLVVASFGVFQYFRIASTLPDVSELRQRASQFETTRIFDRNGNILYEINDPTAGKRTYVPIEEISPFLIAATIATEDKAFYSHPGFDIVALMRALWVNYTTGGQGGGASTITQQLARVLLLSPEERYERTLQRKAREIILAAEITRRYSKDDILELYLNEIYYSNMSYGIEAASETYFSTSAQQLIARSSCFPGRAASIPRCLRHIHQSRENSHTPSECPCVNVSAK